MEKGFVRALPIFAWIELEWLEIGLREGVVVRLEDGSYHPVAEEREVIRVVGSIGRNDVKEVKKIWDAKRFLDFLERYEKR